MFITKGINNLIKSIILLTCLFFPLTSSSKELLVLLSENQSIHNEIASLILEDIDIEVNIRLHHEHSKEENNSTNLVIVSIGTRACAKGMENIRSQDILICSLIPAQSYQALLTKHKKSEDDLITLTAVFMDQPIDRQVALARLISPNARSIGTLFGQTSISQRAEFEHYGQLKDFETHHAFLDETQNPVQILTPLIQRSDIFLAIPDNANFNRSVSRWALYITLRNKIPLIGFSPSYSEAGAVVSLYSTPSQLAKQTRGILIDLLSNEQLAPASFPNEFTIVINQSTARTLRMNLPDSQNLSQQLKEIHK